jgi:hypothetical protein
MPDRLRARVLVTALLIMVTVAGIRSLGPPADLARPARNGVIVGGLLECVLLGLLIALRWRHRPSAGELSGRLNRMVSAALVTAMIVVLAVITLRQFRPGRRVVSPSPSSRGPASRVTPVGTQLQLEWLRDLLLALLIIAILMVVLNAWWHRRRRHLERTPQIAVDLAAEADLARAVQSGQRALGELDDARAAIIACYLAMEQSLADVGAERAAAETPDELLARAVKANLVSPGPAGLLTRLFYEARFSTHPMPMSQRDRAERALADLAAELPMSELA